jgi:heme/copper-type cytochrome/quinol oxidase subunit 2
MQTSNALDPQSPQARVIYDLEIVSTIVFVLIFVAVTGAIAYAIFRFRGREGEPDPKQFAGSERVEIIWTAIPFLIVVFLFVLTLHGMNRADPPPAPSPDLIVTGHQFWMPTIEDRTARNAIADRKWGRRSPPRLAIERLSLVSRWTANVSKFPSCDAITNRLAPEGDRSEA